MYDEELIFSVNRKTFAALLLVGTFFFAVISLYLQWENTKELLSTVCIHILATLIVASFIAYFLLYKKGEENKEQIRILGPGKIIDHELDLSRLNTSFWYFSGGTGSETRKVTLPSLGLASKNENNVKQVYILLINPNNTELCKKYCIYRQRNTSMEEWTERKVQLKIYATILSCVYWINNSPLDIDVFLKNTFSTMRFDISDERVIISKGDPKEPAYLISKPNFFYNCLLQEFHQVSGQAEKLNLLQADHPFTELLNEDGVIPAEILATQFAKIGISDSFTTKEAEYIVQNAKPDFRRCKLQPAIV